MTQIIFGDALEQLKAIPDNSVHCCVTSPPYYALRDYGVSGQIGLEKSPDEYIKRLVDVFHEVWRVLRDDGTLWLNIGDSYADHKMGNIKSKDLIGIPWILAFALRADGWYLRQDIIWYKPNCMPESVKDRCTRSHEYIFLLSKSDKYYFDYEAIQEFALTSDRTSPRGSKGTKTPNKGTKTPNKGRRKQDMVSKDRYIGFNDRYFSKSSPLKKRKRDVWSVSTVGYKEAHFATFPPKLVEPCILAGCPKDGTVLDPFLGSGTTAEVAESLGRNCIGIELNTNYKTLIETRLKNKEPSKMRLY